MVSKSLHRILLKDKERMRLYDLAIKKSVKKGDTVIDLGCGTGIMGFLALKYGAGKVYAIEKEDIIHLAKAIAFKNGFADRMIFIRRHSLKVKLPERADLVVAELMGNFGIGEGLIESTYDAKLRLLKPQGRIIPKTLNLVTCPVSAESAYKKEVIWNKICGINMDYLQKLTINETIGLGKLQGKLATPRVLGRFILGRDSYAGLDKSLTFCVSRNGKFHGFAGWFQAELTDKVILDSSRNMHWRPILIPVYPPQILKRNDRINVRFMIGSDCSISWNVRVFRQRKEVFSASHSTYFSSPRVLKLVCRR